MEKINSTKILGFEEFAEKFSKVDISQKKYNSGGIILATDNQNVYVDDSDSHSIVFGSTGSKKTRMLIMPTIEILKRAGESFIVTDPKGEICQKTAGDLYKFGYHKIIINFREFNKGYKWNPLSLAYDNYHNHCEAKAIEISGMIADMILGDMTKTDPYWVGMAKDVIIGFIVLLMETTSRDECNIRNLITLWGYYKKNKRKFISHIENEYGSSFIGMKLAGLNNESERTVGSIEAVVIGGINKLTMNEEFIDFMSNSTAGLESIVDKTAVYIIVPDENNFYHMAASILISQIYEVLIKGAQKRKDCKLPVRTNFIIDEFTNLPAISNIESMITASRSRNIRFMLVVQSISQLNEKYHDAQVIVSNCNNWIYLYSKEFSLLNQISQLCGNVVYDNGITVPLLSEFDLQHLSKEEGEALVLAGRNAPCIVNLKDIDEYPFKNKEYLLKELPKGIVKVISEDDFYNASSKNNKKLYKVSRNEIWDFVDSQKPYKPKTLMALNYNMPWLVAVYDGIVMDGAVCAKDNIADRMIFVGELINTYGLDTVKSFSWFEGLYSTKNKASKLLAENPGLVYLTLEEIESSGLNTFMTPVKNPLVEMKIASESEVENPLGMETYKWKVKLTIREYDKEYKEIDLEELEAEESKAGLECVIYKAFRMANKQIGDNVFAKAEWKLDRHYSSDKLFLFSKHISTMNMVSLIVEREDYRTTCEPVEYYPDERDFI